MESERVDFTTLDVASSEFIKSLPLDVGVLQNEEIQATLIAMALSGTTSWRLFPFETFTHAKELVKDQHLHVFITHWHVGEDHSENNQVTQLVDLLRSTRGSPGVGKGPLLVASYSDKRDEFVFFLESKYDLSLEKPFRVSDLIQRISSRLYQLLPVTISRRRNRLDI